MKRIVSFISLIIMLFFMGTEQVLASEMSSEASITFKVSSKEATEKDNGNAFLPKTGEKTGNIVTVSIGMSFILVVFLELSRRRRVENERNEP